MNKHKITGALFTSCLALLLMLNGCIAVTQKPESRLVDSVSDAAAVLPSITQEKYNFPFLADPKSGQWSIAFYDLDRDSMVYEYQSERALVPASVQKLLTTGAALQLLGKDTQIATDIYYDGTIDHKSRVLHGNLIVVGHYDPSLGRSFLMDSTAIDLEEVARVLKQNLGVERISGRIICPQEQNDLFAYPAGWELDDLATDYAPLITPLSFAGNLVSMKIKNDSTQIFPTYPLKICKDTVDFPGTTIRRIPYSDSLVVSSSFKQPVSELIPVAHPSLLFTLVLQNILAKNKIIVENKIVPAGTKTLLTSIKGQSVAEMVNQANTFSNNFYAEQLFCLNIASFGGDLSLASSSMRYPDERAAVAKKMFASLYGLQDFNVTDGSGLSRRDFLSAAHLVKVLKTMQKHPDFGTYLSSLPKPGKEGTLRKRFLSDSFGDKLFAKTGSMTGVGNLAGYLITANNRRLAFAILNNYNFYTRAETNQKIEDIMTIISLR